jgi:NADPH-dependent curcumin reductase CurA
MPPVTTRRVLLKSRPVGAPKPSDFEIVEQPVPSPKDGEMLCRTVYLSLDPYMRGRMEDTRSYADPVRLDETMVGGTVGVVAESNDRTFAIGDSVAGMLGWQEYGVADGKSLHRIDTTRVPMSAYLGPVGMPGVTAWFGLNKICEPKPGETVLVSAASGAVGSVVGQLARQAGCRAVGIAGGPEKCRYVVDELGFDVCLDHREHTDLRSMSKALRNAAPDGIDCIFENVGGIGFDAALARMNPHGRIALCGLIAGYDGEDISLTRVRALLILRLKLQGFIISEHLEHWPQALKELGAAVADGRLRYRETIANGLAAAPAALIDLLKGRNFGKQLVKLV